MLNKMNKFNEIALAFIRAYRPTKQQQILAEQRYNVCINCEYFGESRPIFGDEYCKECLCVISKKIFSPQFDACAKHFWLEVDKEYYIEKREIQEKTKKTLI